MMLIASVSCIRDTYDSGDVLNIGDYLPDFTVTLNDGSQVTGEYMRGAVSCIVFFHTSCPDCSGLLPQMKEIYHEYTAKGVRFVFISREEEEASVASFWKENDLDMPYSAQKDRKVYELFAKSRVPRVYVSSDDGIIRSIFTDDPVPSQKNIRDSIGSLL